MQLARAGSLAALVLLVVACDSARKIEETAAVNDCARCHGFPPPDPHPQATNCDVCHSTTVGPGNVIISGGTHMDGKVEVTVHALPYPPSAHGPAADGGPAACATCHGTNFDGGTAGVSCNDCHAAQVAASAPDWRTNCTFCHGTRTANWTDANLPLAAPPQAVAGATATTDPKVGAHQAHLVGTTYVNPLPCTSCHGVPVRQFPGSLDHITGTVEIAFNGLAGTGVTPAYAGAGGTCAVYCHGTGTAFVNRGAPAGSANVSPAWTNAAAIACAGCHGTPPTTGQHGIANHAFPCNRCHVEVAGSGTTPTITNKALHVNGTKNVAFTVSGTWDATQAKCSNIACHGGNDTRDWYPITP